MIVVSTFLAVKYVQWCQRATTSRWLKSGRGNRIISVQFKLGQRSQAHSKCSNGWVLVGGGLSCIFSPPKLVCLAVRELTTQQAALKLCYSLVPSSLSELARNKLRQLICLTSVKLQEGSLSVSYCFIWKISLLPNSVFLSQHVQNWAFSQKTDLQSWLLLHLCRQSCSLSWKFLTCLTHSETLSVRAEWAYVISLYFPYRREVK